MKDILSKNEILKHIQYEFDDDNLLLLDTVTSTNQYCKELIDNNIHHEVLVVANTQTAGRGRMGRHFFSPEGTGIYMSQIINCMNLKIPSSLLTIAAGVSICRVLTNIYNINASIKWVNDIFANGKKVCGILAEGILSPSTNQPEYIIVGIGLNVTTPNNIFPNDIQDIAGSIFPESTTRNKIISQITNEFHNIYTKENYKQLIDEYKSYSLILGKTISFVSNGKSLIGIAININNDGNLIVRLDNNEIIVLNSGEVSLRSENFSN